MNLKKGINSIYCLFFCLFYSDLKEMIMNAYIILTKKN